MKICIEILLFNYSQVIILVLERETLEWRICFNDEEDKNGKIRTKTITLNKFGRTLKPGPDPSKRKPVHWVISPQPHFLKAIAGFLRNTDVHLSRCEIFFRPIETSPSFCPYFRFQTSHPNSPAYLLHGKEVVQWVALKAYTYILSDDTD